MKRIVVLLLAACASNPELPKAADGKQADQAQVKILLDRANAEYKGGTKLAQVESTMMAYEDVLRVDPDNREALVHAAEMHYFHGEDIVPIADKDKRMASFLKGREQALRALALNAKFRAAYEKDNDIVKQLPLLTQDDIPALYWAALNWAKWGELYGIVRAAIDIPKVKAMMEHVQRINPTYQGNAADRFFIGYWVAIPGFAGKDAKKSKAAYEKAVKESPTCLANHVTYAAYYARDTEDRALFESTLKKVLETQVVDMPFLNGIAKEEAAGHLTHTKEYFE